MKRKKLLRLWIPAMLITLFTSCVKDFDIKLNSNTPLLIVEAYINNELPLYNYVVLGKSQDYFNPDFENLTVSGAKVSITEGVLRQDNTYEWNQASKVEMREIQIPVINQTMLPGVYFDPRLATNPASALMGRPGYHYLLEIEAEGKQYSSVTAMLPPITIDTITVGHYYNDDDGEGGQVVPKARLTVYYQDPDTIGNTNLYYWQIASEQPRFGWGGMGASRFSPGTDDLINGEYVRLTHGNGFVVGDTVSYHMVSVERKVYSFWDTFNKARTNGGPFATPATISSTIEGEDVLGCFSGFSLSSKQVIIR